MTQINKKIVKNVENLKAKSYQAASEFQAAVGFAREN